MINLLPGLWSRFQAIFFVSNKNHGRVFGNHIIIKFADAYCLLAHLQHGSISANAGGSVEVDTVLGTLGHCGSSHLPHLHFQLMDSADLSHVQGLACCFEKHMEKRENKWVAVYGKTPSKLYAVGHAG